MFILFDSDGSWLLPSVCSFVRSFVRPFVCLFVQNSKLAVGCSFLFCVSFVMFVRCVVCSSVRVRRFCVACSPSCLRLVRLGTDLTSLSVFALSSSRLLRLSVYLLCQSFRLSSVAFVSMCLCVDVSKGLQQATVLRHCHLICLPVRRSTRVIRL